MAEKEKKRKRVAENNETAPNKRPAISNTVKVNGISEAQTLGPVLASAPGLVIPPSLEFKPYSKSRPKSRSKHQYSDSELLLHSISHPTIDYTAREGISGQDDSLRHYVGVYDHEAGELSLVEVRSMRVQGTIRQRSPPPKEKQEMETKSYADKQKDLIESYGNKKSLKFLQEGETARKLLGPASEAALLATARELRESGEELTAIEKMERALKESGRPLPSPDLRTEILSEVYSLKSLIVNYDSTMAQLKIDGWKKSVNDNVPINMTHRFPANRVIRVVQDTKNAKDRDLKIRVLQYLLVLLQFHSALRKPKDRSSNATIPSKPEILYRAVPAAASYGVVDAVKRKYVESGTILTTNALILLRTTILALTLHVDDFKTDIRDIIRDLDIDMPTVQKFYKDLGCKSHKPVEKEWKDFNVKTKAQAAALKVFKLQIPVEISTGRQRGRRGR